MRSDTSFCISTCARPEEGSIKAAMNIAAVANRNGMKTSHGSGLRSIP
jgi:hypothetical protein